MFPVNPTGSDVDMNTLWALSEDDFVSKLEAKSTQFRKEQEERERLAEEKRLADIEAAKQQAIIDEQKRQAAAAAAELEKKKQEEERKQAELEAASDKVKWDEFLKQVKELPSFEFKSGQFRGKMKQATEKIAQILSL